MNLQVLRLVMALLGTIIAADISCPTLECIKDAPNIAAGDSPHLQNFICFQHDGKNPTQKLLGDSCDYFQAKLEEFPMGSKLKCDFDVMTDKFSWIDENNQHLNAAGEYGDRTVSQLNQRRTEAHCRESKSLMNNLLGGRNCTDPTQCKSMRCESKTPDDQVKKCVGRVDGESCHDHYDCDAGHFCFQKEEHPYLSTCKKFRASFEQCQTTEECKHFHYCWYGDMTDSPVYFEYLKAKGKSYDKNDQKDSKKCLPIYSQRAGTKFGWFPETRDQIKKLDFLKRLKYEDFQRNGRYCMSGLAFYNETGGNAACVDAVQIQQFGKNLTHENNYTCDPRQQEPCKIFYTKEKSFDVPCRCSLDGEPGSGFCASIIGLPEYAEALSKIKIMQGKNECHTMDRNNLESTLDCNVEFQLLEPAIRSYFTINYWPYIHNKGVKECMEQMTRTSWGNIFQEGASGLQLKMLILGLSLLYTQF